MAKRMVIPTLFPTETRVKDYVYETRSECQYAFKKNRLENLGQAAEYAGTGIAFFDRLISEAERNQ